MFSSAFRSLDFATLRQDDSLPRQSASMFYEWDDSDVILSTTDTAAMLEVYYVAAVERRKLKKLKACEITRKVEKCERPCRQ